MQGCSPGWGRGPGARGSQEVLEAAPRFRGSVLQPGASPPRSPHLLGHRGHLAIPRPLDPAESFARCRGRRWEAWPQCSLPAWGGAGLGHLAPAPCSVSPSFLIHHRLRVVGREHDVNQIGNSQHQAYSRCLLSVGAPPSPSPGDGSGERCHWQILHGCAR